MNDPSSHPLAKLAAERDRVAAQRVAERFIAKQRLWQLAREIVDGAGPKDYPTLEVELSKIGVSFEQLKQAVDLLVSQRDATRHAAETDEQERERVRLQREAFAAEEAREAAERQRVLAANGATPVDINEACRRLRAGSCNQPFVLPNENAP